MKTGIKLNKQHIIKTGSDVLNTGEYFTDTYWLNPHIEYVIISTLNSGV